LSSFIKEEVPFREEDFEENNETFVATDTNCGNYEKKNDCEDNNECARDKEFKLCENIQTIDREENYQLAIEDPENVETSQEIVVHSNKNTQNIN